MPEYTDILRLNSTFTSMHKLLDILQGSDVSAAKIEAIVATGKRCHIKNQTRLVEPNTVCDKIYLVLEGGFVCRYIDEELDIEKTINFYLADFHPFMSCVDSYFSATKTQCELRAISHAEVLMFDKKDVDHFIQEDIQLFQLYHALVTQALQEENDFKLKIISFPSERLYQYLITHCPKLIQQVPAKYIAEFMGISPEWLSKLKRRV